MTETWRPVIGYEERFEISSDGNMRRIGSTSNCVLTRKPDGYLCVGLSRKGGTRSEKFRTRLVHPLVLEAFVGPRPPGADACHANGVRHDNRLVNLRWASRSDNEMDKFRHGTKVRGLSHPTSLGHGCIERAVDLIAAGSSERAVAKWLGVGRQALRRGLANYRAAQTPMGMCA